MSAHCSVKLEIYIWLSLIHIISYDQTWFTKYIYIYISKHFFGQLLNNCWNALLGFHISPSPNGIYWRTHKLGKIILNCVKLGHLFDISPILKNLQLLFLIMDLEDKWQKQTWISRIQSFKHFHIINITFSILMKMCWSSAQSIRPVWVNNLLTRLLIK